MLHFLSGEKSKWRFLSSKSLIGEDTIVSYLRIRSHSRKSTSTLANTSLKNLKSVNLHPSTNVRNHSSLDMTILTWHAFFMSMALSIKILSQIQSDISIISDSLNCPVSSISKFSGNCRRDFLEYLHDTNRSSWRWERFTNMVDKSHFLISQ